MPVDRSLDVRVDFTGTQASDGSYSGTATYAKIDCSPPMDVLASDGDIDLENLQCHPDYHWAIGINYTLNAVVTDRNGNPVACTWAHPLDKACAITGPHGGGSNGMAASLSGATLSIANPNNDRSKSNPADRTYTYELGVMLPSVDNYFICLDPKITNTGSSTVMP